MTGTQTSDLLNCDIINSFFFFFKPLHLLEFVTTVINADTALK